MKKPTLTDSLQAILPHLSPQIATEEALLHLHKQAQLLAPIPRAGFECRLSQGTSQLDLQQGISAKDNEPQILAQHIAVASLKPEYEQSAWHRLQKFCQLWSKPNSCLHESITEIWLEFDLKDSLSHTLAPSIFISLNREITEQNKAFTVAITALELLWGQPIADPLRSNLRLCFEACPTSTRISHLGVMLSRQVEALRVIVNWLPPDQIAAYLQQIGYSGLADEIETLAVQFLDVFDSVRICLDVGTAVYPKIGLECALTQQSGLDPRWSLVLDDLVAKGLCTSEKRDALLAWVGFTTPASSPHPWSNHLIVESLLQPSDRLSVFERGLSHIKLTYQPNHALEAKAYFGFLHHWLGDSVADNQQKQRVSTSENLDRNPLDTAIAAAIRFLLSARNQGGWWRDFDFQQEGGRSDEWVTGYVGTALAAQPDAQAQQAARWAWSLLAKRHQHCEGWGYNSLAPADADSTVWALHLASAVGAGECERTQKALHFLEQHLNPNGGLITYLEALVTPYVEQKYQYAPGSASVEGWCSLHPCVTAAAANLPHLGEKPLDFLRQSQRTDGSWQGYWWHDDEYTTALATQALAKKGNQEDTQRVQLAVRWTARRINPNGAVYSAVCGSDSAFATALCLQILNLSDSQQSALLKLAVNWLIENQQADGSWNSSAMFRLPTPSTVNPSHRPSHNFPDDRRLFTTATVLAALSAVKTRYPT